MSRLSLFACAALFATPALAQRAPIAPLRSPGEPMRLLSMQNQSGQVITAAEAQMSDGRMRVLTYAPVQPNEARAVVLPRQECLESLTVHLNNGQTLRAAHMHDCKAPRIFIRAASIDTKSIMQRSIDAGRIGPGHSRTRADVKRKPRELSQHG